MGNRVGPPRIALPTFLNFSHYHAFRNGGPRMTWDSHSSSMEEPNVDEREWVMEFCTNTTTMQGIYEGAHFGANYGFQLLHMDFLFGLSI